MPTATPPAITAHGLLAAEALDVTEDRVAVRALEVVAEVGDAGGCLVGQLGRLVLALGAQVLADGAHVVRDALGLLAGLRRAGVDLVANAVACLARWPPAPSPGPGRRRPAPSREPWTWRRRDHARPGRCSRLCWCRTYSRCSPLGDGSARARTSALNRVDGERRSPSVQDGCVAPSDEDGAAGHPAVLASSGPAQQPPSGNRAVSGIGRSRADSGRGRCRAVLRVALGNA